MIKIKFLFYIGILLTCLAPLTHAGEWQFTRQINVETLYTDNLYLTADSHSKPRQQDALIMSLSPGIVLTGKTKRTTLDLAYSAQYLKYSTADIEPQLYHHLQADSHLELVSEHLFLDTRASAGQSQINAEMISGADATNPTGNVQNVYMYGFTPSYKSRLRHWLELSLQFETNAIIYTDNDQLADVDDTSAVSQLLPTEDSRANRASLELRGGSIQNTSVGLQLETEKQSVDNSQFSSANLLYGQQLDANWRYDSVLGYEKDKYTTGDIEDETQGLNWEFSTTWRPSSRTSLKVGVNGHYFGVAPLIEWEHRHRHSNWTASFARTLTTTHSEQLQSKVFQFTNGLGEQTTPNTSDSNFLSSNQITTLDDQVFIADTFNTSYALEVGRNTFDVLLNYSVRNATNSQQESELWHSSFVWTRRLNKKTSFNLDLNWEQMQDSASPTVSVTNESAVTNGQLNRTTHHAEMSLVRQLTRRTAIGLSYGLRKDTEYTENRVILALQANWDH